MDEQSLERVRLGGVELEYETGGTGEPVVLVHAGVCAGWFQPLMGRPVLADQAMERYRASDRVSPVWGERQALLLAWRPDVEPFVLPGATHLLQVQDLDGMAEGLADLYQRHPLEG